MGAPMCANLIRAGYPVVVYNRTKEKEQWILSQGATAAKHPAALMRDCEVIITMVTDDAAVRELFTGEEGLLAAGVEGRILINMSTVSPLISKELAVLCRQQNNDYLDAPVSGSVKQAQDAQLVIMAGGKPTVFAQAKPVLDKLGKMALHVGEYGAGNQAKLAINILLGLHAQGLAEATVFATRHGISHEDLYTLLNNGAMANGFMKIKSEAIRDDNYQPAFALKHALKDLRLAKDEGMNTPLGNAMLSSFQAAEQSHGEEDIIAIMKFLDNQAPAD